jgi:hypothetical protein
MLNTSRCNEIDKRFPGLIRSIVSAYQFRLSAGRRWRSGDKSNPTKRAMKRT